MKLGDPITFVRTNVSHIVDHQDGDDGFYQTLCLLRYPHSQPTVQQAHMPVDICSNCHGLWKDTPPPTQALRYNEGKPKLSYLLSFVGGYRLICPTLTQYLTPLDYLGQWYRGEIQIGSALEGFYRALPPNWPELVCDVCIYGEKKYARGNYLLGRPWSDTLDSMLRHLRKLGQGELIDPEMRLAHEGPIGWNTMFLEHCVKKMPEFDDRLRPPSKPPVIIDTGSSTGIGGNAFMDNRRD